MEEYRSEPERSWQASLQTLGSTEERETLLHSKDGVTGRHDRICAFIRHKVSRGTATAAGGMGGSIFRCITRYCI